MNQDWENEVSRFIALLSVLPQPHKLIFPYLLHNPSGDVSHAIRKVRKVLQWHHIFIVPATRKLDKRMLPVGVRLEATLVGSNQDEAGCEKSIVLIGGSLGVKYGCES